MLYCTGFLAFAGTGEKSSPRQVTLYNSVTRSVIRNLQLPSAVLNLGLNRQYMAVILEQKTMIYTLGENFDLLCSIPTPPNPRGVAALSLIPQASSSPSIYNKVLLALPGDQSKGVIRVHDISQNGEGSVLEIDAHLTSLGLVVWSPDGTMLASASVKGTLIRVFDAVQGTKLFTLRRGTKPTRITSMAFSPPKKDSPTLLCVASERGSVHVFRLMGGKSARQPDPRSVAGMTFSAMVHKTSMCCGERIAKIKLPCKPGTAAVCSFQSSPKSEVAAESGNEMEEEELKIHVATSEGILYQYSILSDAIKGVAQTSLEGQWVFA